MVKRRKGNVRTRKKVKEHATRIMDRVHIAVNSDPVNSPQHPEWSNEVHVIIKQAMTAEGAALVKEFPGELFLINIALDYVLNALRTEEAKTIAAVVGGHGVDILENIEETNKDELTKKRF